jgi:hypothetical protein
MRLLTLATAAVALALSGCASTMYVGNVPCHPYGIANQQDQCPQAEYEVRPGNAAAAAILFPAFPLGTIVSGYLVTYRLWGPVRPSQSTQPPQQ